MSSLTLDGVIDILKKGISTWGWSGQIAPFEIDANQFRGFAIEDSKTDSVHGRVNALSNIKRAIECRIDELLYFYCLYIKSKRENWNFPKKIEILGELGIIAPRILTKINQQRNLLEHEYINPSPENVDDALDVAILFLGYTDIFTSKGPLTHFGKGKWKIVIERENDKILFTNGKVEQEIEIGCEDIWIEIAKQIIKYEPH